MFNIIEEKNKKNREIDLLFSLYYKQLKIIKNRVINFRILFLRYVTGGRGKSKVY